MILNSIGLFECFTGTIPAPVTGPTITVSALVTGPTITVSAPVTGPTETIIDEYIDVECVPMVNKKRLATDLGPSLVKFARVALPEVNMINAGRSYISEIYNINLCIT